MRGLDVLAFDDNGAAISSDVKPELIDQFLPGRDPSTLRHIWAGAIALRKNDNGINFAATWSEHSTFDAVAPFTELPPPGGFVWNSCDQAVLSALWNSKNLLTTSIRREVQYLYRSRVIPPPNFISRYVKTQARRRRKKILTKPPR